MSGGWEQGGLDQLAPVERETVQDRIYRQLRSGLICGGFDAGEVFLATDVASRMSVSSMPVREALARLVSERALEAMPNRRVRVPLLSLDRARDIVAARCLIECELAQRAMEHLTGPDSQGLEKLTRAYDAASDPRDVAQLNHAFHFAIYGKAGSSVLLPIVESLWMQAGPYVRAAARLYDAAHDTIATVHHSEIVHAMQRGDPAGVTASLTSDIQRAFHILERAAPAFWIKEQDAA